MLLSKVVDNIVDHIIVFTFLMCDWETVNDVNVSFEYVFFFFFILLKRVFAFEAFQINSMNSFYAWNVSNVFIVFIGSGCYFVYQSYWICSGIQTIRFLMSNKNIYIEWLFVIFYIPWSMLCLLPMIKYMLATSLF